MLAEEGLGPGRIELVGGARNAAFARPFVMQIRFAWHAKVSYADLPKKRRLSLWSFLIYPKREQTASQSQVAEARARARAAAISISEC